MSFSRGGTKCDLGYNHAQFLKDLRTGMPKAPRTGEPTKMPSLSKTIANVLGSVSEVAVRDIESVGRMSCDATQRVVASTLGAVHDMAEIIDEATDPTRRSETEVCVDNKEHGLSIRIPTNIDACEQGAIKQVACPRDLSDRCGGCIVDIAIADPSVADRFPSTLAIAKGEVNPADFC